MQPLLLKQGTLIQVHQAWKVMLAKLTNARQPWCIIAGPMGAVLQTLLEHKWKPHGPWCWESPMQHTFQIDPGTPH
eukprot:1098865-Prorocentrum_lima.AAC.1